MSDKSDDGSVGTRPRVIYIDCTTTFYSGLRTGIQRVVRNLAGRADHLSRAFGMPIVPVVYTHGAFRRVRVESGKTHEPGVLRAHGTQSPLVSLARKQISRIRYALIRWRFAYWVTRALWRFGVLLVRPVLRLIVAARNPAVRVQKGELFLYADSWWGYGVLTKAENLHHRCCVVGIVYDLIPLTHPDLVDERHRANYLETFSTLISNCDGLIAISKFVRDETKAYLARVGIREVPVDYFYLGADIAEADASGSRSAGIREWPEGLWGSASVYLMVGTIEPRKGHRIALETFERLWAEGFQGRLLVIGRAGWMCEDIIASFERSSHKDKKLFVFSDVDDAELANCYRQATAIIFASTVEGFGLPLVEAMQLGKTVLASDIPVFREIGKDYPVYFEHESATSLYEAVKQLETTSRSRNVQARRTWLTWDDSAQMLIEKAIALYQRSYYGKRVTAADLAESVHS